MKKTLILLALLTAISTFGQQQPVNTIANIDQRIELLTRRSSHLHTTWFLCDAAGLILILAAPAPTPTVSTTNGAGVVTTQSSNGLRDAMIYGGYTFTLAGLICLIAGWGDIVAAHNLEIIKQTRLSFGCHKYGIGICYNF